ncbi:Putative ribonuclease H protein At1g65750 [Linum perenne]
MRVELRGIVEGTQLAWDKGIRKLRIQSDSRVAVELLSNPSEGNNQHIYCEANFAADFLANFGHELNIGLHVFDFLNPSLMYWLSFDLVGSCTSCLIPNNM